MGRYYHFLGVLSLSTKAPVVCEPTDIGGKEDQRRELEAFAATLASTSRLLRLLTYIGEKCFLGETDKLHEYDIATEVFGRSKTTFNPGEDAIVRVEAHRLRKRLKEYYEGEGKDRDIHISIPSGSYVLVFTHRVPATETPKSEVVPPHPRPRFLKGAVASVALVLIVLTASIAIHMRRAKKESNIGEASIASATVLPVSGTFATTPLRILAGYLGKPRIDSAGAVWLPDDYLHFGGIWDLPESFVQRTSDPFLFQHWRNGTFSYDIPLRPGAYELHLYFLAVDPNATEPSTFSVSANGHPLLSGFDINSDAMGPKIADERVFRDISPGSDGILHLDFNSESAPAMVNAIEILPGLPHSLLPIRIITQPTSFTDETGHFWHPDNYYMGGYTSQKQMAVTGTPDPALYSAERYDHFTYAIPVDTRDQYTLVLRFAELYFGPSASGVGGVGSRVFRVMCNGNILLDNFDIYKEAGSLHAVTETFHHLKPTAQGKLDITFEPMVNNATVSGIEVLDESQ
jgi:hypothetical protein